MIHLTSPQRTTSRLLAKRPGDDSSRGLDKWPFTSVEFWGEKPQGEWTLKITDEKVKLWPETVPVHYTVTRPK